jgi:hypothetical integral membrane protein (TIGR02206 family)
MKNWFGTGEPGFSIFSWEHHLCIFVIIVIPLVMYIFRDVLRERNVIKKSLIIGLIFSEAVYHAWAIYNGMWTVKLYLPLQLCSLNVLLSIVLLFTENKKLFAFVYLFGFTGALQAILTPELFEQAWHFRFIQFFFVHGLIIWTAMYYAIIRRLKITWTNFFFSFVMLNVFAGFTFIVNIFLNSNYMFLMSKPDNASLLDYLGPHPVYIFVLELVVLCLSSLVFIPVIENTTKTIKTNHST